METILKDLQGRIGNALAALTQEMSSIRSNRPSPALVEDLKISYFGSEVPLKQLGSISTMPPRDIVITLWDASNGELVGKAIADSKRGYNPTIKGASIYITLPPLTQERRAELVKIAKAISEKFKIEMRQFRDGANKSLATEELSEDMVATAKKKIQEKIDLANKAIEELLNRKIAEMEE